MGWWAAAGAVVRDLIAPRPMTLDLQPLQTFDAAPRPIDQVIAQMQSATRVSREMALQVAAVQRGRNEICAISTLPLRLYRGLSAVDAPLFRQFDVDVPNVVHIATTVEDLAFEGIAWWRVMGRDAANYPAAVRRVDPARVHVKPPAGRTVDPNSPRRYVWIQSDNGKGYEQVPASDMIRFDSPNPGILKANARAVRIAWKLDRITEMYADNPALREYFTDADDPSVAPMRDDEIDVFLAEYGALRSMRPYGWIPKTVKRADVTVPSPKDLTLVELRQEVNLAIANGLGVDPEDLGVSTTSRTYFNSVDKKQDKINRVYGAYMGAIVDRLRMGDVTMRGYEPRFDLSDYLKSDPVTQAGYWNALKGMNVVDEQWIAEQAGIDPAVARRASQAAPAPAPADPGQNRLRLVGNFAGDGPGFTFHASDFAAAPAAPTVDPSSRTITGLAVPYGQVARKYGMAIRFMPGSLEYGAPERMAHLMDHATPVGFARSVTETKDGPVVALAVLDAPDGSPAKVQRDQLLYDAQHGLYSGLSVGVVYSLDPDDGDVEIVQDDVHGTVVNVVRASWRETSSTYMPAFDDARVTKVAASLTGGGTMHCQYCGNQHAPGIACAAFARQLQTMPAPVPAPAPAPVPGQPAPAPAPAPGTPPAQQFAGATFEQFQQWMAAQQQNVPPAAGPTLVNPDPGVVQVKEPQPYRFDRKGNLRPGSHDFSADLGAGWAPDGGDQAARDRANGWLKYCFERKEFGAGETDQQFAITPANVSALNYPQNRPEMYVDQLEFEYPLWNAVSKGTLASMTPFLLPKFNSSSGLVGDHVSGTEPTPGAFTATNQTITPSALSGKVEILRETWDQGGNPQASGLIWRQIVRAYYEGLEAYVQAQLVALAASIPDITITALAVDSALDQAIADALVPLQYIRGGDHFSTVFTQIDLYKAMVKAKDGQGRRLYPSINPQNSVGQARPGYTALEAHGKLWLPAWALAASGTVAASSWMFDPDAVSAWASAPERIDLQWRVAWVDVGVWGYKAFAVTDFSRTRELLYDPV